MRLGDFVKAVDTGFAQLRTRAGEIIAGREWGEEKSVVEVHGWVDVICRERGKLVPGNCRSGHNVWTNTGREYLSQLMSLKTAPSTAFRTDTIGYMGIGCGAKIEEQGVTSLDIPLAFDTGLYLAAIDPPSFPLSPTLTTVRYYRTFAERELTIDPDSQVFLSELGLFTNGSPSSVPAFSPGTRDIRMSNAQLQAPVAYKAIEPIGKTTAMQLEVSWEIRF